MLPRTKWPNGHEMRRATGANARRTSGARSSDILIDQGLADQFLAVQLKPELFEIACAQAGQRLILRRHAGYDHGYYFIQSFIADHLAHHAKTLVR